MGVPTGVKRVKSGCVTCRIRRVKCDEEKPECRRCLSTGRKCDGYSIVPFSRRDLQAASQSSSTALNPYFTKGHIKQDGLLPRLITDPAFGDLLEKRYFQFFRQQTVVATNSLVDSRFWDRVVLQAAHTEPAIKHAVLALSSLHQLSSLPHDDGTNYQHRLFAERQHHKALEEARNLISSSSSTDPSDVDRILVACIIFIIFEGVRGDYSAAAMHMDSGRAIVAQNAHRLKLSSRRRDLTEIEQTFARLDVPALCFSDRSAPYPYNLTDFYQTNPMLTPGHFQDVSEAQACFIDLVRWMLLIGNHNDNCQLSGDIESIARNEVEKNRCSALMSQWHCHFEDVVLRSGESSSLMTLNLRMWYAASKGLLEAGTYGPETRFDKILHYFEQIVNFGERIAERIATSKESRTFSFDLGYTIPVYLAATRCRDPRVRRRAINVLCNFPRQEGMWESTAAGAIARQWLIIEESGLGEITCAADVPEGRRIKVLDPLIDVESKTASVHWTNPAGEKEEVVVDWKPGSPEADSEEFFSAHCSKPAPSLLAQDALPKFEVRLAASPNTNLNSYFKDDDVHEASSSIMKAEIMC